MLVEPVAVAVGLERWPAVRAWLSNTHVPLASLQLTAADGRAAQQVIAWVLLRGCCWTVPGFPAAPVVFGVGFWYTVVEGSSPSSADVLSWAASPPHEADEESVLLVTNELHVVYLLIACSCSSCCARRTSSASQGAT
jgi:hypothetical protein